MQNSNIVLIGMPGSGKSTVGVLLAKELLMPYIDTDLIIQQKENRFLQDIINNDGIDKFLSIEENVILTLNTDKHVIATGGSVILKSSAIHHLKQNGVLIYLQLSYPEINKRIQNITTRGIAKHNNQSLLDVYNERVPLYEEYSDITIGCSNKSTEEIIIEIKKNYKECIKRQS
jgi:shikimate kinase